MNISLMHPFCCAASTAMQHGPTQKPWNWRGLLPAAKWMVVLSCLKTANPVESSSTMPSGWWDQRSPLPPREEMIHALMQAQENCFRVGLTSVQDAGLSKTVVELIREQHNSGKLKIRINAWLTPSEENFTHFVEKGPFRTDHLSVNTIKLFTDGALGSRGALMIEDYSDDPGNRGLLVNPTGDP